MTGHSFHRNFRIKGFVYEVSNFVYVVIFTVVHYNMTLH